MLFVGVKVGVGVCVGQKTLSVFTKRHSVHDEKLSDINTINTLLVVVVSIKVAQPKNPESV